MSSKLLADTLHLAEYERPYIAQALLDSFIGDWSEFQRRAIEIFDQNNSDLVMQRWSEIDAASKLGKRAARYKKAIEGLAEKLGLRASWGAQETHEIIRGAATTYRLTGKPKWRPLGGLGRFGGPDGFMIEIKQFVDYPQEWTEVREAILAKARQLYEAGRQCMKWGDTPYRKSAPTLSRNVRWLFEHITLGKSYKVIAREAQLEGVSQHKRSRYTKERESVTEDDVKKAVSRTAKMLKIRLS